MLTIQCVQTFFGAITFALTLLLVFKTNASYNRWQDARRAIGMLTSTAHNLARQVGQGVGQDIQEPQCLRSCLFLAQLLTHVLLAGVLAKVLAK